MKEASFMKIKGSHGDVENSTDQVLKSHISTKEEDTITSIGRPFILFLK
jgi:hypothetical protein